jgi:hypothetical protein
MVSPDTIFSFKNLQEKIHLFRLANWNIVKIKEDNIVTVYATWVDDRTMLKLGSYEEDKKEKEPAPAIV